jgi:histidinol-phosphate aminotransferase
MSFDLSTVIRPAIRALSAYQTGASPPGRIAAKLDANESPFLLRQTVRDRLAAEMAEALGSVALNRYPDPEARELRAVLAEALGLSPAQILVSNGSDEAIQLLSMAVAGPGLSVLAPVPTFVMYELCSQVLGLRFVGIPLREDFGLDAERFLTALRRERPPVVFLAWPNNPTGRLFDRAGVEAIVRESAGLVVVDEAYTDYSGQTFLRELARYPNLVILRTLSKIGLAGIRLGMLIASAAVIEELNKVRLPYNVNALSQAAARVVLRHGAVVRERAQTIVTERERLLAALQDLAGVTAYPSDANFFLIRTARPAEVVFQGLLARGVLVRNFSMMPRLANCLRVTVGTREENDHFLAALTASLGDGR